MGALLDAARRIAAEQEKIPVSNNEINEFNEITHSKVEGDGSDRQKASVRRGVGGYKSDNADLGYRYSVDEAERATFTDWDWPGYYRWRRDVWLGMGREPDDALRWAWRQTADQWFRRHGTKAPEWACAGCGEQLTGKDVHLLPFGQRAHGTNECVAAYGKRWQREARAALEPMGIPTPPLDEDGLA